MYEVTASIDLRAPASRVWDVVTSFDQYDEWNPVIIRMQAMLTKGAPMAFTAKAAGRTEKIRGEMLGIDYGRELGWRRPLSSPSAWWFRSERHLRVTATGGEASRFVQTERFAGLSLPFIWGRLKPAVEKAFGEMNRALQVRAESVRSGPPSGPTSSSRRLC